MTAPTTPSEALNRIHALDDRPEVCQSLDTIRVHIADLQSQLTAALARAEASEADAGRYRWLRGRAYIQDEFEFWIDPVSAIDFKPGAQLNEMHSTLDAAIDAAITQEPPANG